MIITFIPIFIIIFIIDNSNSFDIKNSTLYDYDRQQVPYEYVIVYNQFQLELFRHETISTILNANNITNFDFLEKNKIFNKYPSDFDVIKIYSKTDAAILHFLKHYSIKSITTHIKLTRTLKALKNDEDDEEQLDNNKNGLLQNKNRKIFRAIPKQIIDQIDAKYMWNKGFTGKNVNVAVFDTGLEVNHPHFKNVIERIDWTDEKNPDDKIGHGTFVCGVIASYKECLGIAPDVNLYIFKVFTDKQVSYTSWFLDAFNYAILKKIDVLNLSIGGPDFMDFPFINKVWEMTSNNIIMVSGIGNDGPLYGTSNNPADMNDVIGVGGINSEDQIARFSSRGMTTWELPDGYGRVKPDIVTYCTHVRGSKKTGGCRTLSGTSVASPIIAGAVALLVSVFKKRKLSYDFNPANIKQILMSSSRRVPGANIFEQGNGKLNLIEAYKVMRKYTPQVSLIPSYLDLTECPHFWPYCSQPLYYSGLPVIVNITVLNGMDVHGRFKKRPEWHPSKATHGDYLRMTFEYSNELWPWSGNLAVRISVSSNASNYDGVVDGLIKVIIESTSKNMESEVYFYVKAKIIPTPARKHRLLWDQFHNLRYPPGYFPRDNLKMKNDPLDWNGDHLHTNFKEMYQYLRNAGYFIEILGISYNCFDAENYGALLIIDSEEDFHETEISKIYSDVISKGLSLIIFADWYNTSVIKAAKFFDENSRQLWTPVTGGSNIPALNDLLDPFGIAFGDRVFEGDYQIGEHTTSYASGANIVKFPNKNGYLTYRNLKDQGEEFLFDSFNITTSDKIAKIENVAILGLYQTENSANLNVKPGRIVAYGDSNCLDSSHMKIDCYWLLSAVIEYAIHNNVYRLFKESLAEDFINSDSTPKRIDLGLNKYSKFSPTNALINSILTCLIADFEPNFYINKVPMQFLPTKKNYFSFLKLNDKMQSEEENIEMKTADFKDDTINIVAQDSDNLINETQFPFITSFALVLVLGFVFYKIWKLRKRIRYKRFTNIRRLSK